LTIVESLCSLCKITEKKATKLLTYPDMLDEAPPM